MTKSPGTSPAWRGYIISTPDVLRGKPRIDGTLIPVAHISRYLASGANANDTIAGFPDLRVEDNCSCLDYARGLADFEVAAT